MKGIVKAKLYDSHNQLLATREAENFFTIEGRNIFLNAAFKNIDTIDVANLGWGGGVLLRGNDELNPGWQPEVTDNWQHWRLPVYKKNPSFSFTNVVLAPYAPTFVTGPEITSDMIFQFDSIPPDDGLFSYMDQIAGIFIVAKYDTTQIGLISVVLFHTAMTYVVNSQLKLNYTIYL